MTVDRLFLIFSRMALVAVCLFAFQLCSVLKRFMLRSYCVVE